MKGFGSKPSKTSGLLVLGGTNGIWLLTDEICFPCCHRRSLPFILKGAQKHSGDQQFWEGVPWQEVPTAITNDHFYMKVAEMFMFRGVVPPFWGGRGQQGGGVVAAKFPRLGTPKCRFHCGLASRFVADTRFRRGNVSRLQRQLRAGKTL